MAQRVRDDVVVGEDAGGDVEAAVDALAHADHGRPDARPGEFAAGVVCATLARITSWGSESPSGRSSREDQAPAATRTFAVRTVPRSVSTLSTAAPRVRMPRTAQSVTTVAPSSAALRAIAVVAFTGSACPSDGVKSPPA